MRTFDSKEKRGSGDDDRHRSDRSTGSFHRDDAKRPNRDNDGSPFARDKRPRISRPSGGDTDKRGGTPRPQGSEGGDGGERRSFNPNFTKDNRKIGGGGSPYKKSYPKSDRDSDAKPWNKDKRDDSAPKREFSREGAPKPWNKEKRDGAAPKREFNREGGPRPWNKEGRSDERGGYKKEGYNKSGGFKKEGNFRKEGGFGQKPYDKDNYPRFNAPRVTGAIRLNRYIANSGVCSRREADDLIAAGVVTVNGKVITELGSKVNPSDEVRFNNEVIRGEKKVYIVMNKPKGFVTTLDDPHADKTVIDLIKNTVTERVYPVGRLDKNSVGVLLITNDGEMTRQMTHPSFKKKKIYQVSLDKPLTKADIEQIASGIELEDGIVYVDEVSYVNDNKREVGIEIHSGRNRIVRRIFESLGYTVQKLDRVYFAGLTKKSLKRGAWRFLTPREVSILKNGEYE